MSRLTPVLSVLETPRRRTTSSPSQFYLHTELPASLDYRGRHCLKKTNKKLYSIFPSFSEEMWFFYILNDYQELQKEINTLLHFRQLLSQPPVAGEREGS